MGSGGAALLQWDSWQEGEAPLACERKKERPTPVARRVLRGRLHARHHHLWRALRVAACGGRPVRAARLPLLRPTQTPHQGSG